MNQAIIHAARLPASIGLPPGKLIRALRAACRMSQAQLSKRAGVPRAHITRLEKGSIDVRLGTLQRLLDAMFCGMVILPLPRKRPSDAVADARLEKEARSGGREGRTVWND
ncbi:MAG: helix-turn-helix transcriptional regulator [Elusimicrobiota bacterium]